MATTTEQPTTSTQVTPPLNPDASQSLPILQIADAAEVKQALEIMFEAYVYGCTWRDESEHHTVCAVYYGFISLLKERGTATT